MNGGHTLSRGNANEVCKKLTEKLKDVKEALMMALKQRLVEAQEKRNDNRCKPL